MCDDEETSSQSESDHSDTQLSLLDLPVEIFIHICSFLDASTLVHGLSLVCKQFRNVLRDDLLWKVRISRIWPNTDYPILPPDQDDELFWKLSCVAIEKQTTIWKDKDALDKLTLTNLHYGIIDCLLLMHGGTICISGARDRCLVCWQLPVDENEMKESITPAHAGWIWDLTAINDTVYSCSWDTTVKSWSLTNTGLVHYITYETTVSTALLCVASYPGDPLFATGSFCKTVLVFDPRVGQRPIMKYQPHQRAIIKLVMSPHVILSASEDKTLSIWDQRAGRVMKNVTISQDSIPMSICMQRDMVYVGDSSAKLHVLNPKKDFELVKSYATQHTQAITGVRAAPGCLITSSKDETVRIFSPTDPPQPLATLTSSYGEIASIDYLNETLAFSDAEGIKIWRPRADIPCAE